MSNIVTKGFLCSFKESGIFYYANLILSMSIEILGLDSPPITK